MFVFAFTLAVPCSMSGLDSVDQEQACCQSGVVFVVTKEVVAGEAVEEDRRR